MKARFGITIIFLIVSCFAKAGADTGSDSFYDLYRELDFSKYYKPYKLNLEPNAPGYTLPLDLNSIVNYKQVDSEFNLSDVQSLIRQNGFAVLALPQYSESILDITLDYKFHSLRGIPVFITTDTLLHIYHLQFEGMLREIEIAHFISDIKNMTSSLLQYNTELYPQLEGDLKEATKRNIAYLSVAQKLIEPESHVSELVEGIVTREIAKIEAHSVFTSSDIFGYDEDYTQYVPRSHYDDVYPDLRCYFKTMMWYGRMGFLLNGGQDFLISEQDAKIQTLQAFLLVWSMEKARVDEHTAFEIFERIHKVMSLLVGPPDDLTPFDYISVLKKVLGESYNIKNINTPSSYQTLKKELMQLPSPNILSGIGNPAAKSLQENLNKTKGMRLMSQRFVPDSYMFQNLVHPRVKRYTGNSNIRPFTYGSTGVRGYPRGLDLMALLGSSEARQILIDEGDTSYVDYRARWGELKNELDKLDQKTWNCNLYWSWLFTLKSLLEENPEGYPNFTRTSVWQKRNLNTALASWTELRHDTILYAKMSGWPAGKVREPKPIPPPPGYVEPVPQLYGRLLALTQMTMRGLSSFDVLPEDAAKRLKALENILERLIEISIKELANQRLTEEEYAFIKDFSTQLTPTIYGIPPDDQTAKLVADVHTFGPDGLVLQEAVGGFDRIVVAFSAPDGSIYLAVGPVLSYYEFKQPMNNRLTDEQWEEILASPRKPKRPKWYVPLMH